MNETAIVNVAFRCDDFCTKEERARRLYPRAHRSNRRVIFGVRHHAENANILDIIFCGTKSRWRVSSETDRRLSGSWVARSIRKHTDFIPRPIKGSSRKNASKHSNNRVSEACERIFDDFSNENEDFRKIFKRNMRFSKIFLMKQ